MLAHRAQDRVAEIVEADTRASSLMHALHVETSSIVSATFTSSDMRVATSDRRRQRRHAGHDRLGGRRGRRGSARRCTAATRRSSRRGGSRSRHECSCWRWPSRSVREVCGDAGRPAPRVPPRPPVAEPTRSVAPPVPPLFKGAGGRHGSTQGDPAADRETSWPRSRGSQRTPRAHASRGRGLGPVARASDVRRPARADRVRVFISRRRRGRHVRRDSDRAPARAIGDEPRVLLRA